jgi:hypothetical protein
MTGAEVTQAPGGYVIRCETPFAAVEIVRQLETIEGVEHAYSLVRRTLVTR